MAGLTPEELDALLPQTQCGLCGYGGCMPYAEAIVYEQAPLNLCPPGGVPTLIALGECTQQDVTALIPAMSTTAKAPTLAVIRESECIGCTKCIQACPVDAILGSGKQMHTVITDECNGCELCVPPCPVDCIDIINTGESRITPEQSNQFRIRFQAREKRVQKEKSSKEAKQKKISMLSKKNYIADAIARARDKKSNI